MVENRNKCHHQIPHIQNILCTKFHLKEKSLHFRTKFSQKGYFKSKIEKVHTTIEFVIIELASIPNFNLNKEF